MTRRLIVPALLLLVTAGTLAAHDMFLKAESYFVPAGGSVRLHVLNGTFSKSMNSIIRERLRDLSIVNHAGIASPLDRAGWTDVGDTSVVTLSAGESGTYVIGASLLPSEIPLEAKDFNTYLADDGIPDILAARRRDGELNKAVKERYAKHVKAVIQVGPTRTGGFSAALGYPAELIPVNNPYSLRPGGTLRVRALVEGEPVANQVVVSGGRTASGARIAQQTVRTDRDGIARIRVATRGVWYVKFIHMAKATADTVDYESKWATLTFGVR